MVPKIERNPQCQICHLPQCVQEPEEERRDAVKTCIPFAINYYPPVGHLDRFSFFFLLAHHSALPLIHHEEMQCSVKCASCWQG